MLNNLKEADVLINELDNYDSKKIDRIINGAKCKSNYTTEQVLILLSEVIDNNTLLDAELSKIYRKLDRNYKIYFDKNYYHLNNAQLEVKYGIGTRRINKICEEIEKKKNIPNQFHIE